MGAHGPDRDPEKRRKQAEHKRQPEISRQTGRTDRLRHDVHLLRDTVSVDKGQHHRTVRQQAGKRDTRIRADAGYTHQ